MLEKMVARFKESTERHREKRLPKEEANPSESESLMLMVTPRIIIQDEEEIRQVSNPSLTNQTKVNHRVQPGTLANSSRLPLAPSAEKAIQMPEKVNQKATAASFEVETPVGREDHSQTRAGFQPSRIAPQKRENIEPEKQWRRVTPRANDSFWTLSVDHYNDGRHFASLARFNGCVDNIDDLPATIWVPSLAELKAFSSGLAKEKKAASGPGHLPRKSVFYLTQGGETLFDIAREKLGAGARFVEILKSNAQRLPAKCDAQTILQKGIHLSLPAH